jgi:tungstate transport system permease protein
MIVAQSILITPIVAALSRELIEQLYVEYAEQFRSLCLTRRATIAALLWDARYSLLTVALAGFGRATAEVGAIIIVGGNINHLTRMMTTAIALETSKGDLALALALGFVLMTIALVINGGVMALRRTAARYAYA